MKITRFSLFLLFLLAFGCRKSEAPISTDPNETPIETEVKDRDGAPSVPVVNNTLVFSDLNHYNGVRDWVQTASTADLMAWQQNIGFKSSRYYYEEAIGKECCPDEEGNIAAIAAEYAGKVLYDEAENNIEPLLPMRTTGWLSNERGEFKVGQSLIRNTGSHVISVIDGDPAKMTNALNNPVDDPANGVYSHPTVGDRGGCCPWNLNAPSVSTGNSSGSKRIKSAWVTNWDESFSAYVPNFGTMYNVIFTFAGRFHHQRKTWLGWTVCQRTIWRYKAGETARIINIPPNCNCLPPGFVNPKVISINTTSGFECKYNFEQPVFTSLVVTPQVYWAIDLCVEKINVQTTALDSNLSTSASCQ